jgi:tetratricopeptide (TPR) repeat protein
LTQDKSVEPNQEQIKSLVGMRHYQIALPLLQEEALNADQSEYSFDCLYELGKAQVLLSQHDEARRTCQQLIDLRQTDHRGYLLQAFLLSRLGQPESARRLALLNLDGPRKADGLWLLGTIALELSQLNEAEQYLRASLAEDSSSDTCALDLAIAYGYQGKHDQAANLLSERILPKVAEGQIGSSNLMRTGTAYLAIGQLDAALEHYSQALAKDGGSASAYSNCGIIHHIQGRLDEAIACQMMAVLVDPMHAMSHLNLAMASLLLGDYTTGFQEYEWRRTLRDDPVITAQVSIAEITSPDNLPGTVILSHENGVGDCVQFMRYARLFHNLGSETILICPPPLVGLAEHSGMFKEIHTHNNFEIADPVNCGWIPALSIPRVFGATPDSPVVQEPYLQAQPDRVNAWRDKFRGDTKQLIVGLHWQGNPDAERTLFRGRSLPLAAYEPLVSLAGVTFVSLQKGHGSEQLEQSDFRDRFVDCQDEVNETWDFMETLAMIKACDVVISNDSGLAHLAGAVGHPVWLLLALVPEWRWGLEGETTAWYPSMHIHRQTTQGDWATVVESVRQKLVAMGG